MEGGAYAYAYVCKRARLLEQMYGFKRISSGVCKRKGYELAAAGVSSPKGR